MKYVTINRQSHTMNWSNVRWLCWWVWSEHHKLKYIIISILSNQMCTITGHASSEQLEKGRRKMSLVVVTWHAGNWPAAKLQQMPKEMIHLQHISTSGATLKHSSAGERQGCGWTRHRHLWQLMVIQESNISFLKQFFECIEIIAYVQQCWTTHLCVLHVSAIGTNDILLLWQVTARVR